MSLRTCGNKFGHGCNTNWKKTMMLIDMEFLECLPEFVQNYISPQGNARESTYIYMYVVHKEIVNAESSSVLYMIS